MANYPSPLDQLSEKILQLTAENLSLKQRLATMEADVDKLFIDHQNMIMENYRIHEELLEEKEKAEESNTMKTNLLSNLSHEFRTPMNGILGFAEILKENLNDKNQVVMANNILLSGNRLLQTLNSMLYLSELEAGTLPCQLQKIHLNTFVLSNLGEFECRAAEKNIFIKTQFQDWKQNALADNKLLRIALTHLMDNAIKFTDKGGVIIETGSTIVQGENMVFIRISDTGIGIDLPNQEKVFEPYRQLSEGWGRGYEGTGLGLPICRKVIDKLNGKLLVESKYREGSSFTVLLPSAPETAETATNGHWTSIHQTMERSENTSPRETMPEVLIVEDNNVNKELMVVFLTRICRTDYALDGESAVKMARKKKYAAILMDINLGPGIDGLEATRQIRKIPGYEQVPVIAVTGYTLSGDKERLIDGGCSHYLAKPFDKKTIVHLVEDILFEPN
ncbi:MAG: ATP-binding protein [Bacteroidetes bacterium]|nr:ATP-binding protein [Bacteroidota bacterium]